MTYQKSVHGRSTPGAYSKIYGVAYCTYENPFGKRMALPNELYSLQASMACYVCYNCFLCLLFPIIQRGGAYAVLIGGWSLAAYLIQWTWGNLKDLIVNHNQWVIGYLVVVGKGQQQVLSFFLSNFSVSRGTCHLHGKI